MATWVVLTKTLVLSASFSLGAQVCTLADFTLFDAPQPSPWIRRGLVSSAGFVFVGACVLAAAFYSSTNWVGTVQIATFAISESLCLVFEPFQRQRWARTSGNPHGRTPVDTPRGIFRVASLLSFLTARPSRVPSIYTGLGAGMLLWGTLVRSFHGGFWWCPGVRFSGLSVGFGLLQLLFALGVQLLVDGPALMGQLYLCLVLLEVGLVQRDSTHQSWYVFQGLLIGMPLIQGHVFYNGTNTWNQDFVGWFIAYCVVALLNTIVLCRKPPEAEADRPYHPLAEVAILHL